MAFESGTLDATLAAAAGNDPQLIAELRLAFIESLAGHVDLLRRARCDGNWAVTAMRIKGLAASFHAEPLIAAAEDALRAAPGEPAVIQRMERIIAEFDWRTG